MELIQQLDFVYSKPVQTCSVDCCWEVSSSHFEKRVPETESILVKTVE